MRCRVTWEKVDRYVNFLAWRLASLKPPAFGAFEPIARCGVNPRLVTVLVRRSGSHAGAAGGNPFTVPSAVPYVKAHVVVARPRR
mgnify:CR=1 FL=1